MITNIFKVVGTLFFFSVLTIITGCKTQSVNATNHEVKNASANTLMFLSQQKNMAELEKQYDLLTIDGKKYIGAMMMVNSDYNEAAVKQTGALIGTKIGNVISIKIPTDKIKEVLTLSFIQNLDVDTKISIK